MALNLKTQAMSQNKISNLQIFNKDVYIQMTVKYSTEYRIQTVSLCKTLYPVLGETHYM